MLIGVPKEVKNHEYRVGVTPSGVKELVYHGHQVIIESKAGDAIGFTDQLYQAAGALVVPSAAEVYSKANMIVKVKEPQPEECPLIQEGQIIFCFLHLAANPELSQRLIDSGCIAIAMETITAEDGTLPLLAPMSEVAGRVAIQTGVHLLEKAQGGKGVLISGVPGVAPAKVVIIGGGVVGINAAMIAAGMRADVIVLEKSVKRIRELEESYHGAVRVLYNTIEALEYHVKSADLLIGAVLIPGAAAPIIVSENLVMQMKKGSVIIDVAVDQGGCIETTKPTTHDNPTYDFNGVIHYGVTNMPSAVAHTSTQALENATLPYIISLANQGYRSVLKSDLNFRKGLNIYRGRVTHEAVANELSHAYTPAATFLN